MLDNKQIMTKYSKISALKKHDYSVFNNNSIDTMECDEKVIEILKNVEEQLNQLLNESKKIV